MGMEKVSPQAVILLRERHPEFTLQEIGVKAPDEAGWGEPITRERVRQILVNAGKPTANVPKKRRAKRCKFCHAKFVVPWWNRKKKICSRVCRSRWVGQQKHSKTLKKWEKIFEQYADRSPAELARKLHCSYSTIYRVLQALKLPQ